ncbi:MAG: hypothetical protein E7354_02970 [Clostridiales bacterium]|nr:hypothetical protein [Clostridiales bacterium]
MENEYKYMAEVLKTLPKEKPIYIGGHIETPDADSVGSSIALALYLKSMGYDAKALLDEKDNEFLFWYNGDKSVVINSLDNPQNYTFILLDSSDKTRLDIFEEYFDKADITVNIDHHEGNKGESQYIIANGDISSTSEMIYDIFVQMDPELISQDISTLLYAGIMTDTCCFARRLTNRTLLIAQVLINKGIDYKSLIRQLYTKRTMLEVHTYTKLASQIKHYDNFDYIIVDLKSEDFKDVTLYTLTKKVSEELRKLDTLENFLMLVKNGNKITGKTMCNNGDLAGRLALYFGGGGHKTEGGFTIKNMTIGEILEATKRFIANDEYTDNEE